MSYWDDYWGLDSLRPAAKRALQDLLPRGIAWTRRPGALSNLLEGLAFEFDRVVGEAAKVLREMHPGRSFLLLEEWENVLGLPDPCAPAPTLLGARQASAWSKLLSRGVDSWRDAAEALGYPSITISRYDPFTCNSECDDELLVGYWEYAVSVTAPTGPQDAVLRCRLQSLARAHTFVVVTFT